MPAKPYTCPACGREFSRRPTEHTCGVFSIADRLKGKPAPVVALYRRVVALARSCGRVQVRALKTTIGISAPRVMANLTPQKTGLKVQLVLSADREHRTLRRRQAMSTFRISHEFLLTGEADLDQGFELLVWEAWRTASADEDQ